MPIRNETFGGLVPRLDEERLPDIGATEAINCNLRGGVLEPLVVTAPFEALHDGTGLLAGVPADDLVKITKPVAPVELSRERIADPTKWLNIWAFGFYSVINPSTGILQEFTKRSEIIWGRGPPVTSYNMIWTETGFEIIAYISPIAFQFNFGGPYFYRDPRYGMYYAQDPGANGGPTVAVNLPPFDNQSQNMPEFPPQQVALEDNNSNIYAYCQCVDVQGPRLDEDILVFDYASITGFSPPVATEVRFTFNLNYVSASRKHYYYVQSMLDDDDLEGPPSELSERITVKPGERITLTTAFADDPEATPYTKNRLYRAGSQEASDFLLIDDIDAATYVDETSVVKAEPIPPYGNYPEAADPDVLRQGSVIHPSGFAVYFYLDTLYPTDYYRLHVLPDEYTMPFQDTIAAIALTGNTVIVFVGDNVFGVVGNNPKYLAHYLLSASARLKCVNSMVRMGQTIFWATDDGLAASSGSSVEIVTRDHFTREQWAEYGEWDTYGPDAMSITTADNALFIVCGNGTKLRLDFDDKLRSVTEYTVTDGSVETTWKSKPNRSDFPVLYEWARVTADGDATLEVFADGGLVHTEADIATPDYFELTNLNPARTWAYRVSSLSAVRQVEMFDRVVFPVSGEVRFTPETAPCWRNIWLKFADRGRFVAASLNVQDGVEATVRFYADDELVHTETVSDGEVFQLPRTAGDGTYWRVDVESTGLIEELILLPRVTESVGESTRELRGDGLAPWLLKRFEFVGKSELRSVAVHADSYPITMNVYFDGAETPTGDPIVVESDGEIRIDLGTASSFEFDFNGDDETVSEVLMYTVTSEMVGPDGTLFSGATGLRGRRFIFPDRGVWACASVACDNYDSVIMKLYADGEWVYTKTITDAHIFSFPRTLAEAAQWEVEIITTAKIHSGVLLPRKPAVAPGPTVKVTNPRTVSTWLSTRWEYDKPVDLVSILVDADAEVTINLYVDGSETRTGDPIILASGVETILPSVLNAHSLEFDFGGDDYKVRDVHVFGRDPRVIGSEGVRGSEQPNHRMVRYQFDDPNSVACAAVQCGDYSDVTFSLYVDGVEKFQKTVLNGAVFSLPKDLDRVSQFDIDIVTTSADVSFVLIPWRTKPIQGARLRVPRGPGSIPEWLSARYEYDKPVDLVSILVDADSEVTMNLYADGATTPTESIVLASGVETLLPELRVLHAHSLEFDFIRNIEEVDVNEGYKVRDVHVFGRDPRVIGPEGVRDGGRPNHRMVRYQFDDPNSVACASVQCGDYSSVTFRLYVDGVEEFQKTVLNGAVFPLPKDLGRVSQFDIDIETTSADVSFILMPWRTQAVQGTRLKVPRGPGSIPPWLHTRYEWDTPIMLRSGMVKSSDYNNLDIDFYLDGATLKDDDKGVSDRDEFALDVTLGPLQLIVFDFDGDDDAVEMVQLFAEETIPVGNQGIVLRGLGPDTPWRNKTLRFSEIGSFDVARVVTEDYPCDLDLYVGVSRKVNKTVNDTEDFALSASLVNARDWILDLAHSGTVTELHLVGRKFYQVKNNAVVVRAEAGVEPVTWLNRRVKSADPVAFMCARVVASSYSGVTFKLYDSADVLKITVTVTDGVGFRLPRYRPDRNWKFSVVAGDDVLVTEAGMTTSMDGFG